ncbi:zinc finger CW-type PWWP domain protein 2 isoform X7 [Alligator mississippiensis]|uniref:zinc finger CW-type PWWP domain protein 2 isoform X7 n=1 Tax=Alligator mississippiensis TaxID=8496 RepID=UPI0028774218|nr:zinc finger CW-type PWWP domain protein 2 isoform X7 [Alligator mississippiensis]
MSPALRGGGQPNPASRPPSAGQARRGRWLSRRHCQVPQNDPVCTIEYNSPTKFDFWRTRKNEDFAMDSVNENSFYLNKIWVQCENGSCLKWRLLSTDAAAQVDHNEPWYCYMNTDPWFNKCSVSEECFPEESEFHKNGFKYIYSELSIGSLVLVKLCNSPRWPGIICPDPVNGQHVTHDLDGYVDSNHVEYLGDPHSRGWVAVKHISRYSTSVKPERCRRQKKWYKRALEEANKLLACSSEQRLGHLSSKVVSQTEIILKDLERILRHVADPSITACDSYVDGKEKDIGEKMLSDGFLEDLLHDLSRDGSEADQTVVPWNLLLPFLKDGCYIKDALFQSCRTFPNHHKFSKIIASASAIRSANSLSILECITSSPIDLHTSIFFLNRP